LPQFDINLLSAVLPKLPALALALICVGIVRYLQKNALPRAGELPGKWRGGWTYLQSSGGMKALAALCAGFALVGVWFGYLAILHLENPGAWTGPGDAPSSETVVFSLLLAVAVIFGGIYGALAFVRTPMRYSDTEILFRSVLLGREKAIAWSEVQDIDLRNLARPLLGHKGWRQKELCAACTGFRDFVAYARARGVEIAERRRD
jgi:hypothetical protein